MLVFRGRRPTINYQLFLELADKETKGEQITPPGLPVSAGEVVEFMSEDCVTVPEGERG